MKNIERYKEEILKKIDLLHAASNQFGITEDEKIKLCNEMECTECAFSDSLDCASEVREWLDGEYEESAIDWESIPSDTPILVTEGNLKFRRYFAKGKNDADHVLIYTGGCTKWSSDGGLAPRLKENVEFANEADRIRYTRKVKR